MLHQIGSGVLGPVFRTYEPQRDRLVAVKAFRLDLVPEDVARLAGALRRLAAGSPTHPNIVPDVDAGLEGATAFLAMDYVAGETLDVGFRHLAPAPLDRALPVLTQVAEALDAGWAAGLGHGALHPRDIFLTAATNDVRVTGLGVVGALEAINLKAPIRRPYTAPERAAGEPWDIRADVYSLGAIAHELLTRRRPAGPGEQDGAFATGLTPEQRVQVRRVLSAALAERPEHRFATPAAFAAAFQAIALGQVPVLPAEPELSTADKPATKKRAPAATPLLEVIEPAAAAHDTAPAITVREPDDPGPVTIEPLPPLAESGSDTALSHFNSENGDGERAPAPPVVSAPLAPPPPARPALAPLPPPPAAPPAAPAAVHSAPQSHVVLEHHAAIEAVEPADQPFAVPRAEPLNLHGRPTLSPVFGTPSVPAFPWALLAAVILGGLVAGGVGGYQLAIRQPRGATTSDRVPAAAADTEVRVPPTLVTPKPVVTNQPAPTVTPLASPSPPAERSAVAKDKPERPRPTVTVGQLVVRSVPSGALVTVDGHLYGLTPATVRELSLGSHTLQVARPGFVPNSQPIVINGTEPSRQITVELQASPETRSTAQAGTIYVDTRPRGASVTIDGREWGSTPVSRAIAPGSHFVRIELSGYKPVSTTVTVPGGAEVPVTVTLEQTVIRVR